MRNLRLVSLVFFVGFVGGLLSGCGHLDTRPAGDAERIITGTVTSRAVSELPPGSEIVVRVVDLSLGAGRSDILGEQTIKDAKALPTSFRIECDAEDTLLMKSVALEARISVNGRLRYLSTNAHPLTLSNVNDPHAIEVELAEKH